MDSFTATRIARAEIGTEDMGLFIKSWQHLVDTGLAWKLEEPIRKTAQGLINCGYITERRVK